MSDFNKPATKQSTADRQGERDDGMPDVKKMRHSTTSSTSAASDQALVKQSGS